jgi:hypothetical protein
LDDFKKLNWVNLAPNEWDKQEGNSNTKQSRHSIKSEQEMRNKLTCPSTFLSKISIALSATAECMVTEQSGTVEDRES